MAWHSLDPEKVMEKLESNENGLKDGEVERRLKIYGYNEIKSEGRINPLKIFINQFKDFLVIILIVAAIISYFSSSYNNESNVETFLILAILVANGIFGFIQDYKAEKSIEELKKMVRTYSTVLRNGKKERVDARELVPGDVILLQEGDLVPADARLIEANNLSVDESSLTGESVPVSKFTQKIKENTVLAERKNMVYMSTMVVRGSGKAVVVNTGMNTEIGKIAKKIEESDEKETPFQKEMDVLGKKIGILVIIISIIIFLTYFLMDPSSFLKVFLISVSLAVAAVPEGLPAVVTISLALGSKRMAKKNALVRNLSVIESLGSVDVICTDKTGTLTEGKMVVRKIYFNKKIYGVSGHGYDLRGSFSCNGIHVNAKELELILKAGFLCNNAELRSSRDFFGDPTEIALLVSAIKGGITKDILKDYRRVKEIPFSSERKMMSVVFDKNNERIIFSKGATEILLKKCNRIYDNGKIRLLSEKDREEILKYNNEFASNALRVLAFAFKNGDDEKDLIFLGLQAMMDPPRKEVYDAIKDCRNAGIRIVMITGDHKLTARAIAEELGFENIKVITGEEIDRMNEKEFSNAVEKIDIYARVSPEHKVKILRELKKRHIVAMTGDGVNDAPALKNADVGIAMGLRGTDVTKQASDMVLLDDNFVTIRNAIREGRGIFDNIRKFVNYLLSANLGEVLVVFLAAIYSKIFIQNELIIPLTATQLLWINILTDGLPALSLSEDPVEKNIMKRKPRKKEEGVINGRIMFSILTIGSILGILTLILFITNLNNVIKAQTILFTSLVVFELVRIHNIRSRYNLPLFSNKWLIYALLSSIFLQLIVLYTPLSKYFNVIPLNISDWLLIFIFLIIFYIMSIIIIYIENKLFRGEKL